MSYLSQEKCEQLSAEHGVDVSRVEEWYAAFKIFDKNDDGHISCSELMAVLRSLQQDPSEKEIKQMICKLDENDSGQVEFPEFCKHMKEEFRNPEQKKDEIREAFRIFDKDGNNFISADELRSIMTCFGEPLTADEANDMIECADVNGDGKIDYEEFANMMCKL